jgi:hypothetical protein
MADAPASPSPYAVMENLSRRLFMEAFSVRAGALHPLADRTKIAVRYAVRVEWPPGGGPAVAGSLLKAGDRLGARVLAWKQSRQRGACAELVFRFQSPENSDWSRLHNLCAIEVVVRLAPYKQPRPAPEKPRALRQKE